MIVLLSPARNNRVVTDTLLPPTPPLFPDRVEALVKAVRDYSPYQLETLLDVNDKRAFELYDAYQAFDSRAPGSPALLSYYGAAYRNMQPDTFNADDLLFAQRHLRILSALYGLLRPLDGIHPHRLGLGAPIPAVGGDLYTFWGDAVARAVQSEEGPMINIASGAYMKLILPFLNSGDSVITCRFLVQKPDGPKATVATVRAARGLMARHIIQNRITDPAELADFNADGYRFAPFLSDARTLVFVKG